MCFGDSIGVVCDDVDKGKLGAGSFFVGLSYYCRDIDEVSPGRTAAIELPKLSDPRISPISIRGEYVRAYPAPICLFYAGGKI